MGARELALAVAATLLAAGAAELGVRALGIGPQVGLVYHDWFEPSPNPRLRYALRPGAPDGEHRISEAGFRGDDVPELPPAGVFRIAAIGDSVTFGFEVRRDQAWPQQLEALLGEAAVPGAPRFEVLNFGVTGYDVQQIAERARVLALRYGPKLLIYGYVLNDPQDWSFEGETLAALAAHEAPPAPLRWFSRSRLLQLARAAAGLRRYRHTREGDLVGEDGAPVGVSVPNDPAFEAELRGDEADYFRTLHRAAAPRVRDGFEALARAAGDVPVLVAIFPIFPGGTPYPLRDVHRQVAAEAADAGFRVVDLLPVYEAAAARFGARHVGNLLHPNAFGYRVAAHAVLVAAAAEGLLPGGSIDPEQLERGAGAELARLARGVAVAR